MRPYRIVDETFDEDDEYPRVVRIGVGGRARGSPGAPPARRQPWTPRDGVTLPAPRREPAVPAPSSSAGLTRTQAFMLASFAIVCVGMVLGMVLVRVLDEANRAVAALPTDGATTLPARPAAETPAPVPPARPAEPPAPPSTGAITTEIRVLEPNYTVAPGDTLGIIARRHGTSVEALASINNLENRNALSVGQRLIIP